MFKRKDGNGRRSTADIAGDRHQVHTESAEFTMSSTPDPVAEYETEEQESTGAHGPLFSGDHARQLREDWDDIQAGFVDNPRASVQHADELVAATLEEIASIFSAERGRLEQQWDRGDDVTTEELRVVLQRYRTFFNRLLSV